MNNNELNLTMNDMYAPDYIVDAFTNKEGNIDISVDNANIKCLASKDNKFSLDEEGNLVVNTITCNSSSFSILDAYPVGSVYINFTNINPNILFGGTWEQVKGRFLIGQGSCDENTSNAFGYCEAGCTNMIEGELGGEASHLLTIDEMPSHQHNIQGANQTGVSVDWTDRAVTYSSDSKGYSLGVRTNHQGNNKKHNNMPPYIVVYMWKRVA